jgi:hypothetical protein
LRARATRIFSIAVLAAATLWFALGTDSRQCSTVEPVADAAYYYAYLPSLMLDRDLDFTNQYEVTGNWYFLKRTPTGKPGNVFGIGPALFELPAFAIGHGLAIVTGSRRDGFSGWEEALVLWMSVLFGVGALVMAGRLAQRRVGPRWSAWVGPLVVALAGPVAYYATRQPGYAHPAATFFAAWLVERWDASYDGDAPRSLRMWLVLGAVFGAAVLARPQSILWGVLLAAACVDDLRRRGTTKLPVLLARWTAAAALAFVVFLPQLLAWKILYGAYYIVPQGDGFMRWDSIAWLDTLFSSRNGLFPWAPLLLPCLCGLALVRPRRLVIALVAGVFLQALVNGAAWDWWAGGSFGGRRFDSAYIAFALGGAALLDRAIAIVRAGWRKPRALLVEILLVWGALATCAEVVLAGETSAPTARIDGDEAPTSVWIRQVPVVGRPAAWLAWIETFPSAAIFAMRHGTGLSGFDRVEGTHYLGETFPGLNSNGDKQHDVIHFTDHPRFAGFVGRPNGWADLPSGDGRILVGINRRGSIRVRFQVRASGPVTASWNGKKVATSQAIVEFTTDDLKRGVNTLTISGPPHTSIREPELFAIP